MADRSKRLTAHEREHGLQVCVRIEYRRPGRAACSVGSGECSTAWELLPSRAALELLLGGLRVLLKRLGARPVYSPSGEAEGPWLHMPRHELGLERAAEPRPAQGALFEEHTP